MAVCLVIDIPGGQLDQYDAVMRKLGESGGTLGEGQTFHAAGPTDDGFTVNGKSGVRRRFQCTLR